MTNPDVSEADVAQNSRPCQGCGATIYRTVAVAPIKHYCGPECRPRCSVEGCEKPRHGNVYCSAHHSRWKKHGDPLAPLVRTPNEGVCDFDGCEKPMRKARLCVSHYSQQRLGEGLHPLKHQWGDGGYGATHALIRRRRGEPSANPCVDCGNLAQEWSYEGSDPDEVTDGEGRTFTRNLMAYSPRCVRCHRIYDNNPIAVRP